jgi:hypothetical protein
VLEKERKCKYNNTNVIIGLIMCTAAWINVKVSPVIAATPTSEKCKGDWKRRPRVQTQVNGTPMEARVDSGALVSVMRKSELSKQYGNTGICNACQFQQPLTFPE